MRPISIGPHTRHSSGRGNCMKMNVPYLLSIITLSNEPKEILNLETLLCFLLSSIKTIHRTDQERDVSINNFKIIFDIVCCCKDRVRYVNLCVTHI